MKIKVLKLVKVTRHNKILIRYIIHGEVWKVQH